MLDVREEGLNRFLHFAPVLSYESTGASVGMTREREAGFGRNDRAELRMQNLDFRNGVQCTPYRLDSCFRRNDKVR